MRYALIAAGIASVAAFATPALASTAKNVNLCVAAMEREGIAPSGEYRSKFVKSRGASVKTLFIDLIPREGETVNGKCKVARGKVKEVSRA
ncbi:MAG: hypothetical protein AAFX08_00875 [Pseudomonadota bacterium]